MSLKEYREKRDFRISPEPYGSTSRSGSKHSRSRIYVIHKHQASRLHYDLRLEHNGVLLSWAVPKGPSFDPSIKRLAIQVEDHPLEYAKFEGVIPEGQYGAGTVMVWDIGTWERNSVGPGCWFAAAGMAETPESRGCLLNIATSMLLKKISPLRSPGPL